MSFVEMIAYPALGLAAMYFIFRLAGQFAFGKLVKDEYAHIVASDEHKVKGRYQ